MEHAWFSTFDLQLRQATGVPFKVQINPESYTVTASNKHEVKREGAIARQQPIYFTFLGQEPSTISMELIFNTYYGGLPEALLEDVRGSYARLRDYLAIASEEHAPPVLRFAWGSVAFVGVLTQLEENFTMFASTGTPVRARVKVSMQGCMQEEMKSRALHSPDRTKLRTVTQNETIWAISAREYGTPASWRAIALANGIRNPRRLVQAEQLVVPPLTEGG